jgi:hypothetical protein
VRRWKLKTEAFDDKGANWHGKQTASILIIGSDTREEPSLDSLMRSFVTSIRYQI